MRQRHLMDYAMTKKGAEATFPFGPETLVFKVAGKMFALTSHGEEPAAFNLKCDPQRALALREAYACITPGYHMNKVHWNTVKLDGTLSPAELERMLDHSYELVVASLTRAQRSGLSG